MPLSCPSLSKISCPSWSSIKERLTLEPRPLNTRLCQGAWITFLALTIISVALIAVGSKTPSPLAHPLVGNFLLLSSLIALPIALAIIHKAVPPPPEPPQ